ncbi:E3 ubiquitin-protein ligase ptr1 [Nosema granulosis]|uniref:HECT-type E3 ubiquitin transferase n=1 Tax=Nosema granulosis TaxID=83296 RepID=A0A9P6GXA1_9MICR|nr:E3 ubiquitin-protein ligase ptr1 [Nosema granulosis]
MIAKKTKINLSSFSYLEKYFKEEQDDMRLCVFVATLFENWPYKLGDKLKWNNILDEIGIRIERYYKKYFFEGFQCKPFEARDKFVICKLFDIISHFFISTLDTVAMKWFDRLLCFVLCFDKDVIFSASRAAINKGDLNNVTRGSYVQQEILFKLANLDVTVNVLFTNIEDKVYKPIEDIVILNGLYQTLREYSKYHNISDVYISLLLKFCNNDERFLTIMNQNATIILLQKILEENEYYHRRTFMNNLLDLQQQRDYIKKLDTDSLFISSREQFVQELEKEGILEDLENFYNEAIENNLQFSKKTKLNYVDFLKKFMNSNQDIDLEYLFSFERFIVFNQGYDYNMLHLIFILELNKADGIFYKLLEDALRSPEMSKIGIFLIIEALLENNIKNTVNIDFILNLIPKYIHNESSPALQFFFKACLLLITKNNSVFFNGLLERNYNKLFCSAIRQSNIDEKKVIIITFMNILYYLYSKPDTKLEAFEESEYCKICIDLVFRGDNDLTKKCIKFLAYFIHNDPLCLKAIKMADVFEIFERGKEMAIDFDVGVYVINLIEALSLNLSYRRELKCRNIMRYIANRVNDMSGSESYEDFNRTLGYFFKKYPEYVGEYIAVLVEKIEKFNDKYKEQDNNESKQELVRIEHFHDYFYHFFSVIKNKKFSHDLDQLIEPFLTFYIRVCSLSMACTRDKITISIVDKYVITFRLFYKSTKLARAILKNLTEMYNELKKYNDWEDKKVLRLLDQSHKLLAFFVVATERLFERDMSQELFCILDKILDVTLSMFHFTYSFKEEFLSFRNKNFYYDNYISVLNKIKKEEDSHAEQKRAIVLLRGDLYKVLRNIYRITAKKKSRSLDLTSILDKIFNEVNKLLKRENKDSKAEEEKLSYLLYSIHMINDTENSKTIEYFCRWIENFKQFDELNEDQKSGFLDIFGSNYSHKIETKYKKSILRFLKTIEDEEHKRSILYILVQMYSHENDAETVAMISEVAKKKYVYEGFMEKFDFLMVDLDFIAENVYKKRFSAFTYEMKPDSLPYFVFLINYHYDQSMFCLLGPALEALTLFNVEFDREKLLLFVDCLREGGMFQEEYDFESSNASNLNVKMVDKNGFLQIEESKLLEIYNEVVEKLTVVENNVEELVEKKYNEVEKKYNEVEKMTVVENNVEELVEKKYNEVEKMTVVENNVEELVWLFLFSISRYFELKFNKYDVLVDLRILKMCLREDLFSISLIHFLLEDAVDILNIKKIASEKDEYGGTFSYEKDDYVSLIYRIPDILTLEKRKIPEENRKINDTHKTEFTKIEAFKWLMEESCSNPEALFIVSEMVYNYPRYASLIDIEFIRKLTKAYLGKNFGFIRFEDGGKCLSNSKKKCLQFLSICFHSENKLFIQNLIEFIRENLQDEDSLVGMIVILCNVSTACKVDLHDIEEFRGKRIKKEAYRQLVESNLLDDLIKAICRFDKPFKKSSSIPGVREFNLEMIKQLDKYFSSIYSSNTGLDMFRDSIVTSNDIVGIAFNTIYNILYKAYKKKIEKNAIMNVEISVDEIEPDLLHANGDLEKDVENGEKAPLQVASTLSRLVHLHDSFYEIDLSFNYEELSRRAKKLTKSGTQAGGRDFFKSEESEQSDCEMEDDIGIHNGWVPEVSPEQLSRTDDAGIACLLMALTSQRRESNEEYKAIDKNYLKRCDQRIKDAFWVFETFLKSAYNIFDTKMATPKNGTKVAVREETIYTLLDAFFEGRLLSKMQIFNALKMFYIFGATRTAILQRSLRYLLIATAQQKAVNGSIGRNIDNGGVVNFCTNGILLESIKKALEVIRLLTRKDLMDDALPNTKTLFLRCLFALLGYKEVAFKAINLLNDFHFPREIFDSSARVDYEGILLGEEDFEYKKLFEKTYFIGNESKGGLVLRDILNLKDLWISQKETILFKNIISKVPKESSSSLCVLILASIKDLLEDIATDTTSTIFVNYISRKQAINNLDIMLNSSLPGLWESLTNNLYKEIAVFKKKYKVDNKNLAENRNTAENRNIAENKNIVENKNIAKLDFKSLMEIYETDRSTEKCTKPLCRLCNDGYIEDIQGRIYDLVAVGIGPVVDCLSGSDITPFVYEFYKLYFLLMLVYETTCNYIIIWGHRCERVDSVLKSYENLRENFVLFLNANSERINCIWSAKPEMFNSDVEFLIRFNVINFVNKKKYFVERIGILDLFNDEYEIAINRNHVLVDSVPQVMAMTPTQFRSRNLEIFFIKEDGEDEGGLTREWLSLIVRDLAHPTLGLFSYTSEKKTTILPSKSSSATPDYLTYFQFVGRILAKSILDNIPLNFNIDRSAYKYILGKKCDLADLEAIDRQFYNSLVWIKNNPTENVSLTFSIGQPPVDLKPNGRNIPVTDENKQEYIDLIVEYKLFKDIEEQLKAIKQGMFEMIPPDLLSIFNENEFELLISGIPTISVDDWKNNTAYSGYTMESLNIIWFWKAVTSFTPEERAKLLQFCTGSSRVPFEGFSHLQGSTGIQKFSIHKSLYQEGRLPSAHTCFNQLDLPEYSSYVDLRKALIYAINECSEGFGLA